MQGFVIVLIVAWLLLLTARVGEIQDSNVPLVHDVPVERQMEGA